MRMRRCTQQHHTQNMPLRRQASHTHGQLPVVLLFRVHLCTTLHPPPPAHPEHAPAAAPPLLPPPGALCCASPRSAPPRSILDVNEAPDWLTWVAAGVCLASGMAVSAALNAGLGDR